MSNTTWKAFEQKCVRWIRTLGLTAKRNIEESREGNGGDILGELRSWSPDEGNGTGVIAARTIGQAKFRKTPSPWKAQSEADAAASSPSDIAYGIVRRKGDQTLITLRPVIFGAMLLIVGKAIAESSPGVWRDAIDVAFNKETP